MSDRPRDPASFLARWSRLKHQSARAPAGPQDAPAAGASAAPAAAPATVAQHEPAPELPDLETLGFDSDYSAFLQARVDEAVKRSALKKLFHSGPFNVMDGLDVYIDDYGKPDPITPEMLRNLAHARDLLFGDEAAAQPADAAPASAIASSAGVDGTGDVGAQAPSDDPGALQQSLTGQSKTIGDYSPRVAGTQAADLEQSTTSETDAARRQDTPAV